jgi:hypothetical protein
MAQTLRALPLGLRLIAWRPALLAGLIGGFAYLLMQLLWAAGLTGQNEWMWSRMTAAIVLGRDTLLPPDNFDLRIFVVAMLVHFGLALAYALVLALLLYRWHTGAPRASAIFAALVGGAFGFLLYVLNYHAFTSWYAWFADLRHGITIVNNIVFGAVTGLAYVHMARSYRKLDFLHPEESGH